MAIQLCKSQSVIFEELIIVKKYVPIIKWLSNYFHGYGNIKEDLLDLFDYINLDLEKMVALYLTNKNLEQLPNSIGKLSILETISLRGNRSKTLPKITREFNQIGLY